MCLYFQRQRIAKIECHFNEFSRWGTTCFIQIIGWLATLEWPTLAVFFPPLSSLTCVKHYWWSSCSGWINQVVKKCKKEKIESKSINLMRKHGFWHGILVSRHYCSQVVFDSLPLIESFEVFGSLPPPRLFPLFGSLVSLVTFVL